MDIKSKTILKTLMVAILVVFCSALVWPTYFNQTISKIEQVLHIKIAKISEQPFRLGLDLKGGVELLYQANVANLSDKENKAEAMEGLKDVIERRINALGVREPEIQIQQVGENYHLSVKLAGLSDPGQAIKEIGRTPVLEFYEQTPRYDELMSDREDFARKVEAGEILMTDLYKPTKLGGKYLQSAKIDFDPNTNQPLVAIAFDEEGSKIFEELTDRLKGKVLAIFIDGQPISTPVVQDKISGGKAQISGKFTVDEAKKLARNLNEGALPVEILLISQKSVGPTLGEISLKSAMTAGLYGFLAVIAFMVIFYRLPGLLSGLALVSYLILNLAFFKTWPGFTLTLPGIGGFILSLGMAVDANILIFARMKEELHEGKSLTASLEEGVKRAWPAIRDGNLTTIFSGIIMFWFGSGFLKGFATTLVIGVLFSMFAAMIITRVLMELLGMAGLEKVKWLWK